MGLFQEEDARSGLRGGCAPIEVRPPVGSGFFRRVCFVRAGWCACETAVLARCSAGYRSRSASPGRPHAFNLKGIPIISPAPKRLSLSKKLRFEVFKRDGFRCQYCGATAPEILLVVDYAHPVLEGGTNDLLNLRTSCKLCNAGKGKHNPSNQSVLAKQFAQRTELNERRDQLKMKIKWKSETSDINLSS